MQFNANLGVGNNIITMWELVCGIGFTTEDANVACRELGFSDYDRYGLVGALG